MNIFTIIFLHNFSKIFSKTHQIAPFLKSFSGIKPPNPPNKRVASPHCYKNILNPPEMKY